MKFTPEVVAALEVLRAAAENDFERHRIDVLEKDLTAPPIVEILDDKRQKFDSVVYAIRKGGHYGHSIGLHRAVWQYYNGEIPAECVIHHIDMNPANNAIENLKLMTKTEHQALHISPDHIKMMNDSRTFKEFSCVVCGKSFTALDLGMNKYCSIQCKRCADYQARLTEERICKFCGKTFFTDPTWEQQYCSRSCARKDNVAISIANLPKETKKLQPKVCPECGKIFQPIKSRQVFCSRSCAMKFRHRH